MIIIRKPRLLILLFASVMIATACNDSKIKKQKEALQKKSAPVQKAQPKDIKVEYSKEVIELSDQNFNAYIAEGVTLVDFWAVWCGPCKVQSPIVDKVAEELGESAHICKMNVDSNRTIPMRFNITNIPTIIVFKDGQAVKQMTGVQTKKVLVDLVNSYL